MLSGGAMIRVILAPHSPPTQTVYISPGYRIQIIHIYIYIRCPHCGATRLQGARLESQHFIKSCSVDKLFIIKSCSVVTGPVVCGSVVCGSVVL